MQNHRYAFNEQWDPESWLLQLLRSDTWQQEPARAVSDTYFDTFDWRLYGKATILSLTVENSRHCLVFSTVSGEQLALLASAPEPGFAQDLPPGELRRHVQSLTGIRRLVPVVTHHSRQRRLALLNDDGKTILRLLLVTDRCAEDARGARQSLPPQLLVEPLRGYPAPLHKLKKTLDGDASLTPVTQDQLREALAALGRCPAEYRAQPELRLRPDDSARRALASLLLSLLGSMRANLDGIGADIDTEFLHDFRVAVRRTRSVLGQFKGVYPTGLLAAFRQEFARLGAVTGPSRDLDVYLLMFDDYCRMLPEVPRSDLDPFQGFLQQVRARERATMLRELADPRFTEFCFRWQAFLEHDLAEGSTVSAAHTPIKELADRRIWKLYKRCERDGRAINPESPAEDLHELRKTCKKLRYLLEFFQSLHPPEPVTVLIKALKGLQNNLGNIQDLHVQSAAVGTFALRMAEETSAPPATLLAMGMLAESLRQRQCCARDEFHDRFVQFCTVDNRKLFHHLFGPSGRKE
jgi:CHAD domain-containing protein